MTPDELQKWASTVRWLGFGVTFVGLVITGCGYYIADRIFRLNASEKIKSQERLRFSESELATTKAKAAEIEAKLKKITSPRILTTEQIEGIKHFLSGAPSGTVAITFLSVETDAEPYSRQIANVLEECGYNVTIPEKTWLRLNFDGVYIVVRTVDPPVPYVLAIQKAFRMVGVVANAHGDNSFFDSFSPKLPDTCQCVIAVSNRPQN